MTLSDTKFLVPSAAFKHVGIESFHIKKDVLKCGKSVPIRLDQLMNGLIESLYLSNH